MPASTATFARCLAHEQMHTAAVRAYQAAFRASPELADDLLQSHRHQAARAAALAAQRSGEGGNEPDANQRREFVHQALEWLPADLKLHQAGLKGAAPSSRTAAARPLRKRREDVAFVGLRDATSLAWLRNAHQLALDQFWKDVDADLGRNR